MNRSYVEINTEKYLSTGEIEVISTPYTYDQLFEDELGDPPNKGFGIHRLNVLVDMIRAIGGKRGQVMEYILKSKNVHNQELVTLREIANRSNVSLQTVQTTMTALRGANCIRVKRGRLMVNPGIDHRGDRRREAFLYRLYDDFNKEEEIPIDDVEKDS